MPRKKRPRIVPPPEIPAQPFEADQMVAGRSDPPDLESVMRMLAGCVMLLGGKVVLTPIELARIGEETALGLKFSNGNKVVELTLHRISEMSPKAQAIAEQDKRLAEGWNEIKE